MRIQLNPPRARKGAIAVMVAVAAVTLLGLLAFTIDLGLVYAKNQALQTGADAGALAIAINERTWLESNPGASCATLAGRTGGQASAQASAVERVNANAPFGATIPSADVNVARICDPNGVLVVSVTAKAATPALFSRLYSAGNLNSSRSASTALAATATSADWTPFALCSGQARDIINQAAAASAAGLDPENMLVLIEKSKVWDGSTNCGNTGGSGNWGWLNCPSSSLADAVVNGCDDLLKVNPLTTPPSVSVNGQPGDKGGSLDGEMKQRINAGANITLPVYDLVSGTGNNTKFRVVGFLSAQLCGYASKAKKAQTGACYATTDPISGRDVTLTDDSLQLRYSAYTPVGQLNENCPLGNPLCAFNSFSYRMTQ